MIYDKYGLKLTPVFILERVPGRHAELLSRNLIESHFPYLHIPDGRGGIAELPVGVLTHDDIQRIYLFIIILFKNHPAVTDHTVCPHPVAAGHLFVLPHQAGIGAESNTDLGIFL